MSLCSQWFISSLECLPGTLHAHCLQLHHRRLYRREELLVKVLRARLRDYFWAGMVWAERKTARWLERAGKQHGAQVCCSCLEYTRKLWKNVEYLVLYPTRARSASSVRLNNAPTPQIADGSRIPKDSDSDLRRMFLVFFGQTWHRRILLLNLCSRRWACFRA